MTDNPILTAVDELRDARTAEAAVALDLADVRAQTERTKTITLAEAYQSGRVDEKNEQARRLQEADILAFSPAVKEAEVGLRRLESRHTAARIERQYRQDRYQALVALLASISPALLIPAPEE